MAFDRDWNDRDRYNRERGAMDRAGDEVRSWFGDDEAQRRRERDEREARGYSSERWNTGDRERNYSSPRSYEDRNYGRSFEDRSFDRPYSDRTYRQPEYGSQRDRELGRSAAYQPYARGSQEFGSMEPWRTPGPFRGRGPKGYQRSDERIREEVCDRLTAHGMIDASEIEVRIAGGEVTLTGFVDSRDAKRAAEDSVEDVPGVREVNNQLRLRSHSEDQGVGRTSVLGLTEQETQTPEAARRAAATERNTAATERNRNR